MIQVSEDSAYRGISNVGGRHTSAASSSDAGASMQSSSDATALAVMDRMRKVSLTERQPPFPGT